MPEVDTEHLNARSVPWETIVVNREHWLLIHQYEICPGYNHLKASAGFRIPSGYPDTQLDMVYFCPHLARIDGKHIGRLTEFSLDGKSWQQWSRHRTPANPWRVGVDDLSTHLLLVDDWLEREFKIRP